MTAIDDHRIVHAALRPQPGDRILCLAQPAHLAAGLRRHRPSELVVVRPALLFPTLRADGPGFDCLMLADAVDRIPRRQVFALLVEVAAATRPYGRILLWSRCRRLWPLRRLPRVLVALPALQRRLRREARWGFLLDVLVLRHRGFGCPPVLERR
ncbi:hypothetical protein [Actinoplanes sp. G11-F43]|uniref:hypothetical protein n=1 Tax=Actinoplanes sp. G11-F43 TaxID=3424130 RepID=UPI003D3485DF